MQSHRITIPQRADAPETTLYVETVTRAGADKTLLLVPGGPGGNHSVYNAVREKFASLGNLILFDPRGCGYSDAANPEHCTIHHFINDIEAVRQYFGIDKIVAVGGSYGAMAVLGYATKHPEHIQQLILLGGSPSHEFLELAKKNLRARGTQEQITAAESLFNGTFKDPAHFAEYYKTMSPLYLFRTKDKTALAPTTKPGIPYNIDVTNLGFSSFLKTFDFTADLVKITCDTLILSGKNDWINDPSIAESMARQIPRCQLKEFDECGHFIWEDQPEQFFAAVTEFLAAEKPSPTTARKKL